MSDSDRISFLLGVLAVSKDYPEQHGRVIALVASVANGNADQETTPTIAEMLIFRQAGKIPAIKAYRDRTGGSLKECKDAIEGMAGKLGVHWSGDSRPESQKTENDKIMCEYDNN